MRENKETVLVVLCQCSHSPQYYTVCMCEVDILIFELPYFFQAPFLVICR